MAGNNGNGKLPPMNVPILKPQVDVWCWICGSPFKAPPEAKNAPRVVCSRCAAGFEEFLWQLYKNAYQARKDFEARKALDNTPKMAENNEKGGQGETDPS